MTRVNFFPVNGFNPFTGYGKMERGAYHALRDSGLSVEVLPKDNGRDGISLIFASAKWAEGVESKRLWLWSMNESDKPGVEWVKSANSCERVLLPSHSLIHYWREAGVKKPMHYLPIGVDSVGEAPVFSKRVAPKDDEKFTFVTYSLGDMRKGAELAMMAFKRCFGDDPRYRMIVKARDSWNTSWLAGLRDEQITVIGGKQSEADWQALLSSAHAFVFPSRGEGFGMPPREAVLSGLPTIATRWLGMEDADQWSFPVGIAEMRPCQFDTFENNDEGSCWSEPRIDDIDRHMLWIANNYDTAVALAERHRNYLMEECSWQSVGTRFRHLMELYG